METFKNIYLALTKNSLEYTTPFHLSICGPEKKKYFSNQLTMKANKKQYSNMLLIQHYKLTIFNYICCSLAPTWVRGGEKSISGVSPKFFMD